METILGEVQAVDALGRIVILTDACEAVVIYPTDATRGRVIIKGDRVELERVDGQKRMSDWRLVI